jgi:hypothetical protein
MIVGGQFRSRTNLAPETPSTSQTNPINHGRKRSKINEGELYAAVHDRRVAGLSTAGS